MVAPFSPLLFLFLMDSEQGEMSGSRAMPLQEFSQIVLNLFNTLAEHSLLLADSRFSYLSLFMAYIFGIVKAMMVKRKLTKQPYSL
jgi:hypothetical protein